MLLESILGSENAGTLGSAKYSLDSYVNNMVKTSSYIFIGLAVFSIGLTAYAMYKYYRLINESNRYRYRKIKFKYSNIQINNRMKEMLNCFTVNLGDNLD